MAPYGFLDVNDGSDSYLRRMLELAGKLSQGRSVVLRLDAGVRPRVETMLKSLFSESDRSRIELLDKDDNRVIPAVQKAGFCVFGDQDLAAYLRNDQVAVYSSFGRVA